MKKYFYFFILASILGVNAFAQVITLTTLGSGLSGPVCIQNTGTPNDNRLFINERTGRIRIMDRTTGVVNPLPFLDITSRVISGYNEQGLLGLAFDPDYANNGYFYIDYTGTGGIGNTVISRFHVSSFPDSAQLGSEQIMLTIYQPYLNHDGGNLMFGKDGYLYISMGDGGSGGDPQNRAQNIDSLLGKTLRIDVRNPNPPYYFSPTTNPFYGGGAPSSIPYLGTLPGRNEIYNWGLRNPWRCSIDRMTGDKWIADVGQNLWEEIDYESRCDSMGHNYGWRCYEGNAAYSTIGCQPQASYTAPVFVYSHSLGCSVTGGYVYRGGQEGAMFGKYLFADFCSGRIWATEPNGTGGWTTNVLTQTNALLTNNISTFGEDIYGELY
ncbi:MAG: PQQ-dependent sugar dehydrogenase, partial [Bacteroidia bacterium]|nr:PQQ-dependent sugar dehydrogenase [Bacteroidia bacterium]